MKKTLGFAFLGKVILNYAYTKRTCFGGIIHLVGNESERNNASIMMQKYPK